MRAIDIFIVETTAVFMVGLFAYGRRRLRGWRAADEETHAWFRGEVDLYGNPIGPEAPRLYLVDREVGR
jgi:hypothetical protein